MRHRRTPEVGNAITPLLPLIAIGLALVVLAGLVSAIAVGLSAHKDRATKPPALTAEDQIVLTMSACSDESTRVAQAKHGGVSYVGTPDASADPQVLLDGMSWMTDQSVALHDCLQRSRLSCPNVEPCSDAQGHQVPWEGLQSRLAEVKARKLAD